MGSHLKGKKLRRSNLKNDQNHIGYVPDAAVTKHQILAPTGTQGLWPTMVQADADNAAHAISPLYLAVSPGRVDSQRHLSANGVAVLEGSLIGSTSDPVDTSAGSIGDPVFLSNTAGGWSLTAGTHKRRIGRVARVNATTGIILFDGHAASGVTISKTATISAAAGSVAIAFAAAVAGSPVVAMVRGTVADETVADATLTTIVRAYWSGNNVVVDGNANATADTYVSVIVSP